jgi:monovalent cation:H+ antiporter, CPA1 family
MDLTPLIAFAATLLLVIAVSEPIAVRLRAPFALVLTGVGALIGVLLSGIGGEIPLLSLPPSGLFLDLFLPALIFQAALSTQVRRMLEDGIPILILAILAVLVATAVVGLAIAPFAGMPLLACLLLAALVSTTDPSAVIGIFRSISAPARLVRLVEGESLLNDATAIALFGVFLAAIGSGSADPDLLTAALWLPVPLITGTLLGMAAAAMLLIGLRLMREIPTAQVTLTLVGPFVASLPAELVGASGVVSAFAAGAVLNLAGPSRVGPDGWELICKVWGVIAHWVGAAIFLLAALMIPTLLTGFGWTEAGLTLLMGGAALLSRALILWGAIPALALIGAGVHIPVRFRTALLWGGLRGAMTLALALAVLESPLVPDEVASRIGALATGYVLLTLLLQGGTLRWLVRRLRIDRLSPIDQALAREAVAVALQTAREEVSDEGRARGVDPEVLRREARLLGEREQAAIADADRSDGISEKDRVTLGLIALAGRERDLLIAARRMGRIPAGLHQRLLGETDRIMETTRSGGRAGYRRAYRSTLSGDRTLRMAWILHERFRISAPLERALERRFELLIAQAGLLEELPPFIDGRIRRIHGKRVTALLHALIARRREETREALEALRVQLPGYAQETEARWVRRTALEVEEREYRALHEDRLIDQELHDRLLGDLALRRTELDRPPRLDLRARKAELLRGMPTFSGLPDAEIRRLARSLHLRRMSPGDLLHRRGDPPGRIHLIGSGAVSVSARTGPYKLGPGEMFGHIAVLTRSPRRIEVRALTQGTLFRLDETELRRLMGRCPELRGRVEERVKNLSQGDHEPPPDDPGKSV